MNTSDFITFKKDWYITSTPAAQAKFRNWLLTLLGTTIVTVTFRKSDNTERAMQCTTKSEFMGDTVSANDSEYLCKVWDVEAKGWRSFHFDSITDLSFDLL